MHVYACMCGIAYRFQAKHCKTLPEKVAWVWFM
jgi:hypothetical protein